MVNERNQAIYDMRSNGATLMQIGQKFELTRERVRQIIKRVGRWREASALRASYDEEAKRYQEEAGPKLDAIFAQATELMRQLDEMPGEIPNCPIEALALSVRGYNTLRNEGAKTLDDVAKLTEWELLRVPNCGRVTVMEIKAALAEYGLRLGSE